MTTHRPTGLSRGPAGIGDGGEPAWLRTTEVALAVALPNAEDRSLDGQTNGSPRRPFDRARAVLRLADVDAAAIRPPVPRVVRVAS